MAADSLLDQVVTAVQGARSAFQSLCSAIHISESEPRDLVALDASLQSLSTIVETFEIVDAGGGEPDLIGFILATPTIVSASGSQISVADAIIADMQNLEQRLTDVLHDIATASQRPSPAPVRSIPLGEATSIRAMVEKYCSIISEVSNWQPTAITDSVQSSINDMMEMTEHIGRFLNDSMDAIAMMREHMEEIKRMDKSLIMRLYEKLTPVDSARYNSKYSPSGCLEGTRTGVLRLLNDWVHSSRPAFGVFWLSGMAGTGKTTIAKTFCDQLALKGTLGSSFFISRQDEARRDPHNIVRTLAYDLATLSGSRARSVWDGLASIPNVASLHISEQSDRLLARPSPLEPVAGFPTVVVIDALDETDENEEEKEGLVALLVSALKHQAVKLVVTSRDEPRISVRLNGLTDELLKLHRMEQSDISSDVRAFYEDRFRHIIVSRRLSLPEWPSSDDIRALTDRTGHLFVYAATIMKFVSNPRFDPIERLQSILASYYHPSQHRIIFQALDLLYTHIINTAIMVEGVIDEQVRDRVKTLIGTIIVLQHPLPFQSIATLLRASGHKCSEVELRSDLDALASVIPTPERATDPVEIFHPSFPDYMQNPRRCQEPNLAVSSADAHLDTAVACLRLMNSSLCEDICDIQSFTLANAGIADLQERLESYVPESLRYACSYWTAHIVVPAAIPPLIEELNQFCASHLFHWIELLSLLGTLNTASHGLPRVLDWCRVHQGLLAGTQILSLLDDAMQVLQVYRPVLLESALQVYQSVLLTMPRCPLYELEHKQVQGSVPRLISERDSKWQAGITFLQVKKTYMTGQLQFSPRGDFLALSSPDWSDDPAIIWGITRDTFDVTLDFRGPMVFGHAPYEVIIGMRIYDFRLNRVKGVLGDLSTPVSRMATSVDNKLVVCTHRDRVATVWDSNNPQEPKFTQCLNLLSSWAHVESIAFSMDSTVVLLASSDDQILSWCTRTGSASFQHLEYPAGGLDRLYSPPAPNECIVISNGGLYAASVRTWDRSVAIWNLDTGKHIRNMGSNATCIAFSPDGRHLCTGTINERVELFEVETGLQVFAASRHHSHVAAIALSADLRIASLSQDGSIWISEIGSTIQTSTFLGENHRNTHLSITSDGLTCVSASNTGAILWNSAGQSSLVREAANIEGCPRAALSADGTRIAILHAAGLVLIDASAHTTVRMWNFQDILVHYADLTMSANGNTIALAATIYMHGTAVYVAVQDSTDFWRLPSLRYAANECVSAVSMSGTYLACANLVEIGSVEVWDISTRVLIAVTSTMPCFVNHLAFAPDDTCLLIGFETAISLCVFTASQDTPMFYSPVSERSFEAAAFSADSSCVIVHHFDHRVWMLPLRVQVFSMEHGGQSFTSHKPVSPAFTFRCARDGWIYLHSVLCLPIKLCWFPPNQRWKFRTSLCRDFIAGGTRIVFVSGTCLTIVDFAPVLDLLHLRVVPATSSNTSEHFVEELQFPLQRESAPNIWQGVKAQAGQKVQVISVNDNWAQIQSFIEQRKRTISNRRSFEHA